MNWMFMPLHQQADLGFGLLAESFRDAAERLDDGQMNERAGSSRLPVCFLYRHAIELYLKSAITILYLACDVKDENGDPDLIPKVIFENKGKPDKKPIHAEHSIQNLAINLMTYEKALREGLATRSSVKFELEPEILTKVRTIEAYDSKSTYFRYPYDKSSNNDEAKSTMQSIELDKLQERREQNPSKVFAFIVVDDDGNPVEAFHLDQTGTDAAYDALKSVCEYFSGYHAAMRATVTGGF